MRFGISLALITLAACSHEKAPLIPAASTEAKVVAPTRAAPPVDASPNLGVSGDLAQQCQLHFGAVSSAPKFDFDRAELEPADRTVLDQVATCITTGPLKGRKLALVGRADPRGTEEYNLSLGDKRAEQVGSYLQRLGVQPTQVAATTRGELDATGTDEAGWRTDRRVDLKLAD